MVALSEVTASNQRIASTFPDGLVAVFFGGTSGIGEYTVKALAKYVIKPRAYIIGRSQEAADRIIQECQQLNPGGQFLFIKADVSLLKVVDDVCREIKSKESAINILIQSQGSMAYSAKTSEGLLLTASLSMHSRTRFILNLLPLLQNATSLRRVVSVMAASCEGPIDTDNIAGEGFALRQSRDQAASIQSLLLAECARRASDVSFVHNLPGVVKSGIMRDIEWTFGLYIIVGISRLLQPFIAVPTGEAGERHLFLATSARYAPRETSGSDVAGVPLAGSLVKARGCDGQVGSGAYSIDHRGDCSPPNVEKLLATFKDNGTAQKIWDHVMADFKIITGTEVAS